jgi:hypothetical protein
MTQKNDRLGWMRPKLQGKKVRSSLLNRLREYELIFVLDFWQLPHRSFVQGRFCFAQKASSYQRCAEHTVSALRLGGEHTSGIFRILMDVVAQSSSWPTMLATRPSWNKRNSAALDLLPLAESKAIYKREFGNRRTIKMPML